MKELFEFSITSCDSLSCKHRLTMLLGQSWEMVIAESLAALATLLLFDVIRVGVSKQAETTEEEGKVTLTAVVESVGLVPVGE